MAKNSKEIEAAEALLQLGSTPQNRENSTNTEEEEESARTLMYLRCYIAPRVALNEQTGSQNDNSESVCDSENNARMEQSECTPQNNCNRSIISSTPLPSSSAQNNIELCSDLTTQTELCSDLTTQTELCSDQQTQTELCSDLTTQTEESIFFTPPAPTIEEIEEFLNDMYFRLLTVISQIHLYSNDPTAMSESEHNEEDLNIVPNDSSMDTNNPVYERQGLTPEFVEEVVAEEVVEDNGGEEQVNSPIVQIDPNPSTLRVRRMSVETNNNIENENDVDMISIGNGNAKVPARVLRDIDWNSHTTATRKLLKAIFPRRVLATHSLTGKRSPAFLNREPKKMLDPLIVEDIVQTVSTKCGVSRSYVRNSITIKCTDEAKLYRNRQQFAKNQQARKPQQPNDENVRPSTSTSNGVTINGTDEAKLCSNRQQSDENQQAKPQHPNDENVRPSTSSS